MRRPDPGRLSAVHVDLALSVLWIFGGALTREQAETLLGLWKHRSRLTTRERRAVLAAFPSETAGDEKE